MRVQVRFCFLFALLLLILSHQAFPQTHIPEGNVSGKWLKQNSPYYIDGEIKIPRGKKLIIEPGVKIIFTGHYKLIVNGILEAKGNEKDSIYFFPSDTSVGWHGIRFIEAEDFSNLEYCVLKYGKTSTPEELKRINKIDVEAQRDFGEAFGTDGGAILINKSHPVISHCLITNNLASMDGGGIAIKNNSNPLISYCRIKNNISRNDGGGIYCSNGSNPVIKNCLITENFGVGNLGGGITFRDYCSPIIDSCVIKSNTVGYKGGGICFYTNSKPVVKNSVIRNNTATLGGGIYIDEFYNEFREQPGKIDIQIINVRIENNFAEYGGGIWLRDTMGELKGVTICNNRASIAGGGVHIEYNPFPFRFSSENPCNIFMNFARMMGNDLFRLGGGIGIEVPLDTFTVKYYSALNAEPVEKFPITVKNFKLTQVNADLYVNPDGDDSNSGLSPSDPLKSLKIALLKILADSTSPRTIFMSKGEYIFTETNDILMLDKQHYVSVKGSGFTEVIFGTDRITVFTPWWITTWALIIYILIIVSVMLITLNVRMRRIKIKSELDRERFEANKLHEVDEMKSRFFTNISHEFRTPLTLIQGPAKQIIENTNEPQTKDSANFIYRNSLKLIRLVNQLLDLSKLEAGEATIRATQTDVISFIKEIVLSFTPLADRQKITLKLNHDEEQILAYLDKDKMYKIINNILSNAFKFTAEGGRIEVNVTLPTPSVPLPRGDKTLFKVPSIGGDTGVGQKGLTHSEYVEISIRDTGIGIPEDKIDKIFDRFYQVDGSHTGEQEGTGIGLALTKELIELHKGKIDVESKEGEGSTFTISIPLGNEHLKPEQIIDVDKSEDYILSLQEDDLTLYSSYQNKFDAESLNHPQRPTLLVVEDNPDVRSFIKGIFKNEYEIYEASNGEEGMKISFEEIPDLIISDLMMPKMDGFEMCNKIKCDERTSHIPVIMLTAKATNKDKIEGYETGADDYITKPFDSEVLRARVKNLIEQRKKLKEHFIKDGSFNLDDKNITQVDKVFLQKVVQVVNNHLSDTSFGVETFASDIALSRVTLHKKLVSLIGEPPSELIKRIRLSKAAKLLQSKHENISEIALDVGFNNPAYFSECFRKQFGVSPSQYQQKFTIH